MKTLRPDYIKKAIEIMGKSPILDYINNSDWKKLDEEIAINYVQYGWAINGIIWSSIYQIIGPKLFTDLGYVPAGCFAYVDFTDKPIGKFEIPEGVERIDECAFYLADIGDEEENILRIPKSMKQIANRGLAMNKDKNLYLEYPGTEKDWRSIKKDPAYLRKYVDIKGVLLYIIPDNKYILIKS